MILEPVIELASFCRRLRYTSFSRLFVLFAMAQRREKIQWLLSLAERWSPESFKKFRCQDPSLEIHCFVCFVYSVR